MVNCLLFINFPDKSLYVTGLYCARSMGENWGFVASIRPNLDNRRFSFISNTGDIYAFILSFRRCWFPTLGYLGISALSREAHKV
jgi:hypothetical protein